MKKNALRFTVLCAVALLLLGSVQCGKYDQAIGVATGAIKEYADTSLAGEFSALLKQAEKNQKAQEDAARSTNNSIIWMAANPLYGPATSVAFSPDGEIIAAGFYNTFIKLYDATSGNEIRSFHDEGGGIYQLAFSPDGKILASGNTDGVIRLWSVSTGKISKKLRRKDGDFPPFAFIPGGNLLVFEDNGVLHFMDVASGEPQKAIRCEFDGRTVFSPDGKLAAVEHDDLIYLLDTAMGHAIGYLPGKALWAHTISFGPKGVLVAVSSNNNINIALWDIMKLQATTELPGHSKGVQVLTFNPDGTILASGGVDAEIRLWNTGTGKELARLIDGTKGADSVFALAFSPDGKTLAAGYTGRIIVWMAR